MKNALYSQRSLSLSCTEIGHRQSRPVDEYSEEKRVGLGGKKIHEGRNLMAGERENARERNITCCIYTTTLLRKIDRMALFIPSHLLLYVRGKTAENRETACFGVMRACNHVSSVDAFKYFCTSDEAAGLPKPNIECHSPQRPVSSNIGRSFLM